MPAAFHHLLLLPFLISLLPGVQLGQDDMEVTSLPKEDGEAGMMAIPTSVDQIVDHNLPKGGRLHWNDEIYGRVSSQNFELAKSEIATDDGGITIDAEPIKNTIYGNLNNMASNAINQQSEHTPVSKKQEPRMRVLIATTSTATMTTATP